MSAEEQLKIDSWLNQHSRHKELYNEIKKFYAAGSIYKREQVDSAEAYRKIASTIKRRRRFNISVAASIALFIGCSTFYLINSNLRLLQQQKPVQNTKSEIPAGQRKAVLILEDGTEALLTTKSKVNLCQGKTQIRQSQQGLSYSELEEKQEEEVFNTLKIPRGAEYYLELSDGTKIWLNSDTKLKYPVAFVSERRIVELEGEAFFDVVKDTKHPFTVISGGQEVNVLGTQFNINSYSNYDIVRTTLVEGSVSVKTLAGEKINLKPGFQSVYKTTEGSLSSRRVNVTSYIAWKDGMFYFVEEPLKDILLTLERWYDIEFRYQDEVVKQIKLTGKIKRYESLNQVLLTIEKTNEVNFKIEGLLVWVN